MFPSEFVDACNTAISWIGIRLSHAQLNFGPVDFPADRGIGFRNEAYKYAHCYFRTLFHLLHEESTDKWTIRNRDKVFKFTGDHLTRILAMSHFYVQTSKVHLAKVDPDSKHTRIFLDWLSSAYQVPTEIPQGWFKIVTTNHDDDVYWKEARRFFYTEIAYALVSSKDDEENAGLWSGVALMADYLRFNTKDEEWAATCEKHFADYYEDLKKMREPS
jgi:hypothetical protein